MVRALAAAVALAALLGAGDVAAADFRFFGSAGEEGAWRALRDGSPLNPDDFLDLRRRTNAADLTAFGDLVSADHADKLHAKLRASTISGDTSTGKLTLGELYAQHSFGGNVDVTVGRKIEKWGTGYAWNPTGFVNPRKNPTDPNDRLWGYRGLDLVELGLFVREWNVSVVALPDVEWGRRVEASVRRSGWAARAYRLVRGTDLSFVARGGDGSHGAGVSAARVFGDALELHGEAAWSGRARRTVVSPEGIAAVRSDVVQLLVGGQYTFPHDLNLVVEYYHNGDGFTRGEWTSFRAATAAATGSLLAGDPAPLVALNRAYGSSAIGRNYGFQRLYAPVADDRFELEMITIENLRDSSGLVRLTATWKVRPTVQLYVSRTDFWGGRLSEFHYLQVQRLSFAGLRLFF